VGLPFEEALERFRFRNQAVPGVGQVSLPDLATTARTFLGSATPYLKGPLEQITDTQFHTGRKLSDLRSQGLWGGYGLLPDEIAQPLTQIMANSPLARFGTTADKLVDPRKGIGEKALNLGTGLALTDVDTEKLRSVEARQELEKLLRRDPNIRSFTNYYVRPGQAANLSPETARLMQLYTGMKQDAEAYAEEQRRLRLMQSIVPAPF
jgi:hypothetical protein